MLAGLAARLKRRRRKEILAVGIMRINLCRLWSLIWLGLRINLVENHKEHST